MVHFKHRRSVLGVFNFFESCDPILAQVDAVEDIEPVIDSHRYSVELDTVDESGWRAIDAFGRAVLPECSQVAISRVRIVVTVAACNIGLVKVELRGDKVGPIGFEVALRGVHHAEISRLLRISEVLVLFAQACLACVAQSHEVWDELVDLVRVDVVRQWERRDAHSDLIFDRSTQPRSGEQLLENRVESLAVRAEVVLKQLNLDALLVLTLDPSRVLAVDGCRVSRCKCSENGKNCQSFHFESYQNFIIQMAIK